MAQQQLSFQAQLRLAVAENASSPNPGFAGVQIWSTSANKTLTWNGSNWISEAGSGGGSSFGKRPYLWG